MKALAQPASAYASAKADLPVPMAEAWSQVLHLLLHFRRLRFCCLTNPRPQVSFVLQQCQAESVGMKHLEVSCVACRNHPDKSKVSVGRHSCKKSQTATPTNHLP